MVETKCFYTIGSLQFRPILKGIGFLVFLLLLYNQWNSLQNPFHLNLSSSLNHQWQLRGRGIAEINATNFLSDTSVVPHNDPKLCSGLLMLQDYGSKCQYLIDHPECTSGGFFNYIRFFYCDCQKFSFFVGYVMLGIWLVALFYLLGNTAADYFCCSLEKLSNLLKLPPTIAGVCLLPLGNGAPDVFASIAAFVGKDAGEVGLNSVLGGAVFVTCVVVGVVSICSSERRIQIDKTCFIRDLCFFLFTLLSLGVVLIVGKVTVGGAIAFVSIYVIYAFAVAATEILRKHAWRFRLAAVTPMLPIKRSIISHGSDVESVHASLLGADSKTDVPYLQNKLSEWMWASHMTIYSSEVSKASTESAKQEWGWNEEARVNGHLSCTFSKFLLLIEMPLTILRRSTIPIVEEERWSKGYAVASATLAPILLVLLWNTQDDIGILNREISYFIGVACGGIFGVSAYLYTQADKPPHTFLFPWAFGGFFMSIVWFYIIANELVALLVALGVIFGINPAFLGLTVLAWGNSMGDLMSNVALATHGGESIQIAMSGCYAGPMFNTLVGLGLSMLLGAWSSGPECYQVPEDSSLFYAIGFLVLGLIWSLIVLPRNDMRPNKTLGVGLLTIYLMFLISRVATSMDDLLLVRLH